MRHICFFSTILLISYKSFCQQQESLTFFKLPILVDSLYIPSEAYVACNYYVLKETPLNNYKGSNEELSKLALIIRSAALNRESDYFAHSDKTDSTIKNSFEFYSHFLSRSKSPTLISKIEFGPYKIFFVRLQPVFSLMAFCLAQKDNVLLNYPSLLDHPAIIAIIESINQYYLDPGRFKPLRKIPLKNTRVLFDSTFRDWSKSISFNFDLLKINFDCNNKEHASNALPLSAQPALNFYCESIEQLKQGNLEKYYSTLSEGSKLMIKEEVKTLSQVGVDFFINYESSFSLIDRGIDFGLVKLFFVSNPRNSKATSFRRAYLKIHSSKKIKRVNVQHEFYFDDLLRTREFMKAIFE